MADAVFYKTMPGIERPGMAQLLEALQPMRSGLTLAPPPPAAAAPTPPPAVPTPPPAVPAPPVLPVAPVTPTLSAGNPFLNLPQPNAGELIKADHFRQFSRCLQSIQHAYMVSASVFGRTLAEAKPVIAAERLTIQRVMSVFGTLLGNGADSSLDQRRVVQVVPVALGESGLLVVVTEAVETRRLAPNVMGLTYGEASERLRATLGDATFPQMAARVGDLVGRPLGDATRAAVIPNA